MEKKETKRSFLIITYGLLLAAALFYFKDIWSGLQVVFGTLKPFIYGIAIAFILNVLMRFLELRIFTPWSEKRGPRAKKAKRPLALLSTFVITFGLLYALFAFVLPQFVSGLTSLADAFPDYVENFSAFANRFLEHLNLSDYYWEKLSVFGQEILTSSLTAIKGALPAIFGLTVGIGVMIGSFLLGIFFSVYMLYNKETLSTQVKDIIRAFLPGKWADGVFYVGEITNTTFRSFVGGQLLEALIIGTLTYIGLLIFRMPYALVIGVVIGFSSLIPIIGPILGTIPSALLLLMINPMQALGFVIFIIVLQQVEGNLIYPKVVGNSVGLPAIWVMFAILVGGGVFGFVGILVAVPTCAVLGHILTGAVNKRLRREETLT